MSADAYFKSLPVAADCDVLVVGGGPAGVVAAVAAARAGARTLLLERGAFLGGRATASMVLVLDDYTDGHEITVRGLADDYVRRMIDLGGAVETPEKAWIPRRDKPADPEYEYWSSWGFQYLTHPNPRPLTYAVSFDPETFKRVSEEMLTDAGVKFLFYTDIIDVIKEGNVVTELVARRRQGLARYQARCVIDCSGDGDVFAKAGAAFNTGKYITTLVHRLGGVDLDQWVDYERENPEQAAALNKEVRRIYGGSWERWWLRTTLPGVVWINAPHMQGYDALSSEDLTAATLEARDRIWKATSYVKANLPGFQNSYLIDTCAEMGMRQTRLLQGQYVLTKEDVFAARSFADNIGMGRNYHMPYRTLVPQEIGNLLVAGRHFSCQPEAQRTAREIPPCMVMGQAAGTAAALALQQGTTVQNVDVAELQARLVKAGAKL